MYSFYYNNKIYFARKKIENSGYPVQSGLEETLKETRKPLGF